MFDILKDYKSNDHFFFSENQNLEEVCNAPKKGIGVYLVYALKDRRIKLVYIGSAGKVSQNGKLDHQNDGFFDSLVNGIHFEKEKTYPILRFVNQNIQTNQLCLQPILPSSPNSNKN